MLLASLATDFSQRVAVAGNPDIPVGAHDTIIANAILAARAISAATD